MQENVVQIDSGMLINVEFSVKNVMYVEKILGILLHVVVKIENIYQGLKIIRQLCVMKL